MESPASNVLMMCLTGQTHEGGGMLSVTVVIPTYQGARFIGAALSSVFGQSLLPTEVIVVDDASTDDTLSVVEKRASRAPIPVRTLRLARNSGGPARPINTGIASARGELVTVLDQDDTLQPGKIEFQARTLSENPSVAVAACFCGLSKDSGPVRLVEWQFQHYREITGASDNDSAAQLSGQEVLRTLVLRGNFLFGYPAFMFRAADWRAKGGVDERLPIASDYDLLCWLCTRGDAVIWPSAQYIRCEHNANASRNQQKVRLDMARVRARYLAGNPWLLEDEAESHAMHDWFGGLAYALREADNYRGAWECNRLAARVWGWDKLLCQAQCKLPLHWLWRRLTGRSSVGGHHPKTRTRATVTASSEHGP
jgi:glycosyltransferase involved in cell wall biosynthesis